MEEEINYRVLNYLENKISNENFEHIAGRLELTSDYNYKGDKIPTNYQSMSSCRMKPNLSAFNNEQNTLKLFDTLNCMYSENHKFSRRSFALSKIRMNKGQIKTPWRDSNQKISCYFSRFCRNKTTFGHSQISVCTFDRSNKFIITGGDEFKVKVWLVTDGSLQGELIYHTKAINDLIVTKCNSFIVSCDDAGCICIWDLKELELVLSIQNLKTEITHLSNEKYFSHLLKKDMSLLVCCGKNGCIWIYDIDYIKKAYYNNQSLDYKLRGSQKPQYEKFCISVNKGQTCKKKMHSIVTVSMIPNKGLIYAGTYTGDILIFKYDEKSNTYIKICVKELVGCVHLLHRTLDCNYICAGAAGSGAKLWKIPSFYDRDDLFKPEVKNFNTYKMRLRRLQEYEFMDYNKNILCSTDAICYSCSQKYMIISACYQIIENEIENRKCLFNVYDLKRKQSVWQHCLRRNQNNIFVLEGHPLFEEVFVTGGGVGEITIWNISTQSPLKTFQECGTLDRDIFTSSEIFDGKFSNDGKFLSICTSRGTISIYSIYNEDSYLCTPTEQFIGKQIQDESGMNLEEQAKNQVLLKADYTQHPHQLPYPILGKFRNFKLSHSEYQLKYQERLATYEKDHIYHEHTILGHRMLAIEHNRLILNENNQQSNIEQNIENLSTQEVLIAPPDNQADHITNPTLQDDYDDSSDEDYTENERDDANDSNIYADNTVNEHSQDIELRNGRARVPRVNTNILEIDINEDFEELEDLKTESSYDYQLSCDEERVETTNTKPSLKMDLVQNNRNRECARCQCKENLVECKGCLENKNNCEANVSCDSPECFKYRLFPDLQNKVTCLYCIERKLKNEHSKLFDLAITNNDKQFRGRNFISKLDRTHFEIDEVTSNLFCPQIEDEVYFIYQGYEEIMREYSYYIASTSEVNDSFIKTLYDFDKSKPIIRKITNISYCLPSIEIFTLFKSILKNDKATKDLMKVYAKITLEGLSAYSQSPQKNILFFGDKISKKYLVPREKYEKCIGIDIEDLVGKEYELDDPNPMQVKIIGFENYNDLFPTSLYNCLIVVKSTDRNNKKFKISPWELNLGYTVKSSKSLAKYKEKILKEIKDDTEFYSIPHYKIFCDRVDTELYYSYYQIVPVMMCMELIWKRIDNNYYRSKKALIHDIQQIETNCLLFNGESNPLSEIAGEFCYNAILKVNSIFKDSNKNNLIEISEEEAKTSSNPSTQNSQKKNGKSGGFKEEIKDVRGVKRKLKEKQKQILNDQSPEKMNRTTDKQIKGKRSTQNKKTQEDEEEYNINDENLFESKVYTKEEPAPYKCRNRRRKRLDSESLSDYNENRDSTYQPEVSQRKTRYINRK